jgi:hypothetical protein
MPERACGINSVADQRYYHFVVVRRPGVSLSAYWKSLANVGEIARPKVAVPVGGSRFTLEHRKLSSERTYARGASAQLLSDHGKGRPPFFYDLFAGRIDYRQDAYLILGFPFAALALDAVDYLKGNGFLRNAEFQGVDLSELMSERNRPLKRTEGLISKVVGVQFVVTDDKSLTAVRLGGDDPFHAQIYLSFLKPKFEQGLWVPDQCVLACERETPATQRQTSMSLDKILRSRLHVDKSGNFKFYMHVDCTNVTLMPYSILQILAADCLKQVFGNPLRRAEQDEGT